MDNESVSSESTTRVFALLAEVKARAREYYELTGRPLGITAEVAEYEAARLLGITLARVRQSGYDAVGITADGQKEKLQIKGRYVPPCAKPGQRIGRIRLDRTWDAVLLVLLDELFEATAIYKAGRAEITEAVTAPGSKARNERGQLSISRFKAIGRCIWRRP